MAALVWPMPKIFSATDLLNCTEKAVFDVRKSKENSFVVSTEKLDVEVLGTIFNVKAYAEDNDIEISLKEGIVALIQKGKKPSSSTLEKLLQLIRQPAKSGATKGTLKGSCPGATTS
jgi:4-hydroxy-3-methylbut-2-en-1-yl diphosphate synthase IspG/GcpE